MCGRFSLTRESEQVASLFELAEAPRLAPRYNIPPGTPIGAVLRDRDRAGRGNQWRLLHWGLIPSWARDASIGNRMTNARSETAATKPAFRAALKYRRCLVVADGFYEWKRHLPGKQPMRITMADEALFAMAALWEHWQSPEGSEIESCAILTTDANEMMSEIHDRMPVILHHEDYGRWLDPARVSADEVIDLLRPFPSELMLAYPVSKRVNSPKNDDADIVRPVKEINDDPPPMLFDT